MDGWMDSARFSQRITYCATALTIRSDDGFKNLWPCDNFIFNRRRRALFSLQARLLAWHGQKDRAGERARSEIRVAPCFHSFRGVV